MNPYDDLGGLIVREILASAEVRHAAAVAGVALGDISVETEIEGSECIPRLLIAVQLLMGRKSDVAA